MAKGHSSFKLQAVKYLNNDNKNCGLTASRLCLRILQTPTSFSAPPNTVLVEWRQTTLPNVEDDDADIRGRTSYCMQYSKTHDTAEPKVEGFWPICHVDHVNVKQDAELQNAGNKFVEYKEQRGDNEYTFNQQVSVALGLE